MNDIIGLSHLVFSVDQNKKQENILLKTLYDNEKFYEFDHKNIRSPFIRNKENLNSKLNIYNSSFSDMPPIELLTVTNVSKRSKNNYGLIVNDKSLSINQDKIKIEFCNSEFYVLCFFDFFLNSYVAVENNFFNSGNGCWYLAKDFDDQKFFLKSIPSVKIIKDDENIFIIKCRIINKFFSYFTIVLIKDYNEKSNLYNDDIGLSSMGWFSKNLNMDFLNNGKFNSTKKFTINLDKNEFNAKFIYNNMGISHELLKIK